MWITIEVDKEDLEEVNMTPEELKEAIIQDLDDARDYPGFYVKIEVTK
jgi:hypothetical protein